MTKNQKLNALHFSKVLMNVLMILLASIFLFSFSFSYKAHAQSQGNCVNKYKTDTSIFCYQIKRQIELAESLSFLKKNISLKKAKLKSKPASVNKIIAPQILTKVPLLVSPAQLNFSSVKPRTVSRHYETTIAVLDNQGKNNLLHCFEEILSDTPSDGISNQHFYIRAIKKILEPQVKSDPINFKIYKEQLNQKNCTNLFSLVTGQT